MTKILIRNFPSRAQSVRAAAVDDRSDELRFHVGYDSGNEIKELAVSALSSFFSSLIIHDEIFVGFGDLDFLLDALGSTDTITLLDRKILKVVDINQRNVILEDKFEKEKLVLGAITIQEDTMVRFEKGITAQKKINTADKPRLVQYVDNARVQPPSEIYELTGSELEKDLGRKIYSVLGISTASAADVYPQDAFKLLRLADITEHLIMQSKLGLDSIAQDGFVKQYLDIKVGALTSLLQKDTLSPFATIGNLKGIPDLYNLYKHGTITMENILACRETFNGGLFRRWYSSTDYEEARVLRALVNKGAKESSLTRFARVIYPNVLGLIGPLAGLAASAADSYILNRLLEGWNPSFFLDDIYKRNIDQQIAAAEASEKRKQIVKRFGSVGRNAPCPCQSGKKFKNCHGR